MSTAPTPDDVVAYDDIPTSPYTDADPAPQDDVEPDEVV